MARRIVYDFAPGEVRWLLVGSIACVLISTALITKSLDLPENQRSLFWKSSRAMFIAGVLIVLLGVSPIGSITLLVILIVLLLAPVFYGILVWIKVFDARELEK
jgi:hypothetical protein